LSRQASISDYVDKLLREHDELVDRESSPVIEYIEAYYKSHPDGWLAKVKLATHIPASARNHIVDHLQAYFAQRRRPARPRASFNDFATGRIPRAQTRRFQFGRRKNGALFKQDKRTGQFAPFNQRERRAIERTRQGKRVDNRPPLQAKKKRRVE
jgi:hypothetical protein